MSENPEIQVCQASTDIPTRLKAIITAKGVSTKYCIKGLSTYVTMMFQFFIFNTFAKMFKSCFCFVSMWYCIQIEGKT